VLVQLFSWFTALQAAPLLDFAEPTFDDFVLVQSPALLVHCQPVKNLTFTGVGSKQLFVGSVLVQNLIKNLIKQ
jgi:hypothetical protein